MAATQAVQPIITPLDRFGLTLSLAILVHALIILGITFVEEDRSQARYNTMEIVLVQQKSVAPEEADMLAQASQEGGGNVEERVNPAAPLPAPFPDPKPEITTPPPAEAEPPQPPESATTAVDTPEPTQIKKDIVETITAENEASPNPIVEKVDKPSKEKQIAETKEVETTKTESTPVKEITKVKKTRKKVRTPSATELLTNSFKIASLYDSIQRKSEAKAKRPKKKWVSARTTEYKYAEYMKAWLEKVERIGNLNQIRALTQ